MACDLRRVRELIVGFGDVGVLDTDDTVGKLLRVHVRRRTLELLCGVCGELLWFDSDQRSW